MRRVWTAKIAARAEQSGGGTSTSLQRNKVQQDIQSVLGAATNGLPDAGNTRQCMSASPPPARQPTHLSKRPGRSSAGSRQSGRLVAPMTMTPARDCSPSISCSSWLSMRSPTPTPPSPLASRMTARPSISSKKMMAGLDARALQAETEDASKQASVDGGAGEACHLSSERSHPDASPATPHPAPTNRLAPLTWQTARPAPSRSRPRTCCTAPAP